MLKVTVISPERRIVEDVIAKSIHLKTVEGVIQILPGHKAMLSMIEPGPFMIEAEEFMVGFFDKGYMRVFQNHVEVFVEMVSLKDELDQSALEQERQELTQRLMKEKFSPQEYQATLKRLDDVYAKLSIFEGV